MRRAVWGLGAVLLAAAAVVWFLQSARLQDMARARVAAELQKLSGGPVSIAEFRFYWPSLTLVCRGVHAGNVRAERLVIELRWRSLLERKINARRVLVEHPEIWLRGTSISNLPIGAPFVIAVGEYEVTGGIVHFDGREQGFDVRGQNFTADLRRRAGDAAYAFEAGSQSVAIESGCCGKITAEIHTAGVIDPSEVRIEHWRAIAQTVRNGRFTLEGQGTFDRLHALRADGMVKGELGGISGRAQFHYAAGNLSVNDALIAGLGGSFEGQGIVARDRSWSFSGQAKGIALGEATRALGWKHQLPWASRASGTISGSSRSGIVADLRLEGVLSGSVRAAVPTPKDLVFSESRLRLPHTELNFSGSERSGFAVKLDASDWNELRTVLNTTGRGPTLHEEVTFRPGGGAHFNGTLRLDKGRPVIAGQLNVESFNAHGRDWDLLLWRGEAAEDHLRAQEVLLRGSEAEISGAASIGLERWTLRETSEIEAHGRFRVRNANFGLPVSGSIAGEATVDGTIGLPVGSAHLRLDDGQIFGERVRSLQADGVFRGREIYVSHGTLQDLAADTLEFSGRWLGKRVEVNANAHDFLLSRVNGMSGLDGRIAGNASIVAEVDGRMIRPIAVNGRLELSHVSFGGKTLGSAVAQMRTSGTRLEIELNGDLRGSAFSGTAGMDLGTGNPVQGRIRFARLDSSEWLPETVPAKVVTAGEASFGGKLLDWRNWMINARADELQVTAKAFPFVLHNIAPAEFMLADGRLTVRDLQMSGPETTLRVAGWGSSRELNFSADGAVSLKLARMLDPNIGAAEGVVLLRASARGTLEKPVFAGTLRIENGTLGLRDVANELTKLNGSVGFDQNRATIQSMTAEAGGGRLALTGFVTFGGTAPIAYHLESHAESTRVRYGNGVSVTADATLRLTGTSTNSLLSGTARITRIVLNPNADAGSLLTNLAAIAPSPANQKAFASGLQFDVAIESAPNLQISTSLSRDVEAAIDLRLRGTPDRPLLLGTLTANQGDIRVFGGRYTINRGEITFQNASHIEPVLDLDLQTQVRGINVDITISGTFSRLNVAYRSDPPLQPHDIVALLTVGRTPQEAANVQTSQVTGDVNVLQGNPGSLLGQAIAPPSGRLTKLFGITNIKLDPLVQGLTNTPQSRLTIEQQISRAITVTYVTNLEQTSEQIFRFEWALNRQYSIVAVRDDNGEFGIDFQYKKRFK